MSQKDHLPYLKEMGIEIFTRRHVNAAEAPLQDMRHTAQDFAYWQNLQQAVSTCTKCDLHQSRTKAVFGVGKSNAEIMFIGEAPGANEDLQGEPFVGRAGQLLNSMMRSIGLQREEVFIANIIKCRPPQNRDPNPQEVACCTPYLIEQIKFIQPKLLIALGRIAAQFLLNTDSSLTSLRQHNHEYEGTPLLITFHPAYLLRSPTEKAKAWQDFQKIRDFLISN